MTGAADYSGDLFWKEAQLREIGIAEEILLTALSVGNAAALRCTSNHPPIAPGLYRFFEIVRSLGEQTAPLGWSRRDYKNFSTIVRPDGRVAIAVASGDDGVGDVTVPVTTRSPKGTATYEAIAVNLRLPLEELFGEEFNAVASERMATWFLLHARRDGRLYAELSLPKSIAAGYVVEWSPRIPLDAINDDPALLDVSDGEPPVNPIIDIRRRDRT